MIIYIFYAIISVFLIAGVKILDIAYIGSAVYLSVLSTLRTIVRLFLVFISIPCSFLWYHICIISMRTFLI